MKRESLKTAIDELQKKVLEITNNSNHTTKMKNLLIGRELNNLSLNIRRKSYLMDIGSDELTLVSNICGSLEDKSFEQKLMHLLTGADERARYFES